MTVVKGLLTVLVAATLTGAAWAQQPPGEGQGPGAVAQRACEQLREKRGADFDVAGCVAKLTPVAQTAIQKCRDQGLEPRSKEFQDCVRGEMQPAIQALIGTKGDTASQAATIAQNICAKLEQKLKGKYDERFADDAACVAEMEPKAKAALTECSKETSKDAHKRCVSEQIKSQVAATGTSKAAETLAANACKQEKIRKAFGSLENCLEKMVPRAQQAIAKCEQQHEKGSGAYKKCVQAAMRAPKK